MSESQDLGERIASLQTTVEMLAKNSEKTWAYLSKGDDRHTEIVSKLTAITVKQEGMTDYQKNCDKDRQKIDKRITSLEGYNKRQIRFATIVATFAAFLVNKTVDFFTH